MATTPLSQVTTHHDVPLTNVSSWAEFSPTGDTGVSKYRAKLPNESAINTLLVNKSSDVLVVAFHGATMQNKSKLPRFEWMRTLRDTGYSSLYFSDPCLELDKQLQLAWYTGWKDFDLYPVLADWISSAAQAVRASRIILLGSSGGGLASLQIATYLPESLALPFSAQTSVDNYLVAGERISAQRGYMRSVMPHLIPEEGLNSLTPGGEYFKTLGERTSALLRYQKSQPNYVYYVQNTNDDAHVNQHYLPFKDVIEKSPNKHRVRFELQEDRKGHQPPTKANFLSGLESAVTWLRSVS